MTFEEIAPRDANRRLGEFRVVDVRAEHEFRGPLGRVRGAERVPLAEIEARSRELQSGRPLLLVCRSGARSAKACEKLAALGIGPVVNLSGGMIAWVREKLPVEETPPTSLSQLLDSLVSWAAQVGAREPQAVRDDLREALGERSLSFDTPTHDSVARALGLVEVTLRRSGAPPDLEPSLASFRRWLAAL
jgi:rhodanese-related sulfurtransferase